MHLTAWMDRLMLYLRDRAYDGTCWTSWSDLYAIQGGPSLLDGCCVHVRFRILSQPKHIGEFDEN